MEEGEEMEGEGWSLTTATAVEKNVAVAIIERHERREIPHNMCPEVHPPANYSSEKKVVWDHLRPKSDYGSAKEGCGGRSS